MVRWVLLLTVAVLGGCMRDDCARGTTPLDPAWAAKWQDQNDGVADWFWCECHTGQPLAPFALIYGVGPAPIRNLEDGFPWGLGQWLKVSTSDYRLSAGPASLTPREVAKKDFEWRAAALGNCTTRAVCYDPLHMTQTGCAPDPNSPGPADTADPLPGGSGSSGDYP